MKPVVSIVCLCYNHERFVEEALMSVLNQSYTNIEVIVVDDCSLDDSAVVIKRLADQNPNIVFLSLTKNIGNCAAFNKGLAIAKGAFIIDFATDDLMMPDRIEKQVDYFQQLDQDYGIVFTDADYINENRIIFRNHSQHLLTKKLISKVPEGWIFRDVLKSYFICSPTMMVRREVFDELKGYDENLVYEDFDFWVRSSRNFKYAFLNESLTKVRRTGKSMSTGWYEQGDEQLHSTFLICQKAVALCKDEGDKQALLHRVRYEFKQAVFSGNTIEAKLFSDLEGKIDKHNLRFYLFTFLSWLPLPWPWIRKKYHQLFYS